MAFTVAPKDAPPSIPSQSPSANSARERAIAKLTGGTQGLQPPQQTPVANPNAVSPEDLTAIKPPERQQGETTKDLLSALNETNKVEDPAKDSAEETKDTKEEPLSSQYANLARKEKALRAKVQAQEAASKAKEADIAQREEAIKAKEAEYQSRYIDKDTLKADPWTALQELGVTYDQLTQAALNQPQLDPAVRSMIDSLKAEIKATQLAQTKQEQAAKDAQSSSYKQAVEQIRTDVKKLVESDPSFEMVKHTDSVNDVVTLIEETFKKDGILMTVQDAAKEIEEYLFDEVIKVSQLKKVQSRLKPTTPAPEAPKTPTDPQTQQPTKTLTNAMSASRPMTVRERAIAAFHGQKVR